MRRRNGRLAKYLRTVQTSSRQISGQSTLYHEEVATITYEPGTP
jgi:hypothetical protein